MQGTKALEALKERITNYPGPVLSVSLNVNPARSENQGKAYVLRLKSIKDKKAPQALVERVSEYVSWERFQARTLVLFAATDGLFETYGLHMELPEEGHWEEPYVAPLVLATEEYLPFGVVLVDAEKFRFFVASLGEIDEELDAVNLAAGAFGQVSGGVFKAREREGERMSELSEFGVALSRMMDRRAIGFPGLAAVLAERGYHGVSEDELRDYVEGREPVPGSLPPFLVEALGLTPQEENELARSLYFGRMP